MQFPEGLENTPLLICRIQSIFIFRFNAKFTRTFVELDEEAISVMTEIEDDDHTGAGYHSALPLEVHGTAYQPMAMISNTKVR